MAQANEAVKSHTGKAERNGPRRLLRLSNAAPFGTGSRFQFSYAPTQSQVQLVEGAPAAPLVRAQESEIGDQERFRPRKPGTPLVP